MSQVHIPNSDNCGCGCQDGVLPPVVGNEPGGINDIVVREAANIEANLYFEKFQEGSKTVFELRDFNLVRPIVAFSNDHPNIEVGQEIEEVIFTGSITKGTFDISSRSINPDPGGLDLTAPFNFSKANVKGSVAGVLHSHTLSATDARGNTTSVVSRINVRHALYQGFSHLSSLTQAQIKALANKSILYDSILNTALYGGEKSYVVPGVVPARIIWSGPIGSQQIGGATLGGFMVPLIDVGPVVVTNDHDGTITQAYWVKMTANLFNPGTYKITLS
jgi:hypothetical protein